MLIDVLSLGKKKETIWKLVSRRAGLKAGLSLFTCLLLGLSLQVSNGAAATTSALIFQSNFANLSLAGLTLELPNRTNNTFVPWSNRYAFKIQLNDTDPNVYGKKRAELVLKPVAAYGSYTYKFSEYLPASYVPDRSAESIAQWHEIPDTNLGESYRVPAFAILTQNGHFWASGRWDPNALTPNNDLTGRGAGSYMVDLGTYKTEQWNNFTVYVKWSYRSDGILEIYNNNKLLFRRLGPNYYNDQSGPYMKVGVYKWDWTERPGFSQVHNRTLILDNIRESRGFN